MINRVVKHKGTDVLSINVASPLETAAKVMSARQVGSLLVVENDGAHVGLLTEAAIVAALARSRSDGLRQTARSVMVSPVPTCSVSDTVAGALRRMTRERTRYLLVLDQSSVVGIVSIGDLVKVKARLNDIEMENSVLRDISRARLSAFQ